MFNFVDVVFADGVMNNLRKNILFPNSPGNQLSVLRAKVEYKDCLSRYFHY